MDLGSTLSLMAHAFGPRMSTVLLLGLLFRPLVVPRLLTARLPMSSQLGMSRVLSSQPIGLNSLLYVKLWGFAIGMVFQPEFGVTVKESWLVWLVFCRKVRSSGKHADLWTTIAELLDDMTSGSRPIWCIQRNEEDRFLIGFQLLAKGPHWPQRKAPLLSGKTQGSRSPPFCRVDVPTDKSDRRDGLIPLTIVNYRP